MVEVIGEGGETEEISIEIIPGTVHLLEEIFTK